MSLSIDDSAPDFTLASTAGRDFSLSLHASGKPLIIYFYPKDFTLLCTEEACEFRDAFRDLGVDVVGISTDDIATHQKFKAQYNLPFELLADLDAAVAKLYGSTMPVVDMMRRKTFLIDENLCIAAIYENNFSAEGHIKEMVAKLKR